GGDGRDWSFRTPPRHAVRDISPAAAVSTGEARTPKVRSRPVDFVSPLAPPPSPADAVRGLGCRRGGTAFCPTPKEIGRGGGCRPSPGGPPLPFVPSSTPRLPPLRSRRCRTAKDVELPGSPRPPPSDLSRRRPILAPPKRPVLLDLAETSSYRLARAVSTTSAGSPGPNGGRDPAARSRAARRDGVLPPWNWPGRRRNHGRSPPPRAGPSLPCGLACPPDSLRSALDALAGTVRSLRGGRPSFGLTRPCIDASGSSKAVLPTFPVASDTALRRTKSGFGDLRGFTPAVSGHRELSPGSVESEREVFPRRRCGRDERRSAKPPPGGISARRARLGRGSPSLTRGTASPRSRPSFGRPVRRPPVLTGRGPRRMPRPGIRAGHTPRTPSTAPAKVPRRRDVDLPGSSPVLLPAISCGVEGGATPRPGPFVSDEVEESQSISVATTDHGQNLHSRNSTNQVSPRERGHCGHCGRERTTALETPPPRLPVPRSERQSRSAELGDDGLSGGAGRRAPIN
ncbi:hypothetical protein THAOC_18297, partial [Thalassiosira oceanica]